MRAVGFVASPRKGGNSELAVKEILRSLPDDWDKDMIHLYDLNIENCRACYKCVPEGAKCAIKDDLDVYIRNIKHADKVVIAFPTYIFTAPGPVKKIMDRFISMTSDYKRFPAADCVMVLPYGMAGWDGMIKEDGIAFARKSHLNLLAAEVMLATLPGDSVKGENLETLHRLAKMLVDGKDSVPQPEPSVLECPFCMSTALKIRPDGSVRCAVCGGTASLVTENGKFSISYTDEDSHGYFTPEKLDEHSAYLADKKQLFIKNVKDIKALQASYDEPDLWWKDDGGHHSK